jgi:ATP-dependent DNA helicase RecG
VTLEELETLAGGGEGPQVEFKRSIGQRTDAAKTACAMFNGVGGFVLFGVNDDGEVVGQDIGRDTIDDVVRELRRIEPAVPIEPEVVPLESGRAVIALRVPGAHGGPFTYDGRPYHRQGTMTSVMPQAVYRARMLDQMHPSHRWETQRAEGMTLDDLDREEVIRTVESAIQRGRLSDPGTRDTRELLEGLQVLDGGVVTNAAAALFLRDDRILPRYPQFLLRLARFRGTTTAEFIDNKQYHGNIFELFLHAQQFLQQHLPVAGRIVPMLFERADSPLYPLEALREVLANALSHRDYQMGGGSVSIAIFDDRLEVSSTGRLQFGLTVEDLARPHPSRPWNPLIAGVLFRRGIIDQWGRGTLKIRELTQRAGLALPEFEERAGELVVRFFPTGYVAPSRVDFALGELHQEILTLLAARGRLGLSHLTSLVPGTVDSGEVRDALQVLRSLNLAKPTGHGRGARWEVVK